MWSYQGPLGSYRVPAKEPLAAPRSLKLTLAANGSTAHLESRPPLPQLSLWNCHKGPSKPGLDALDAGYTDFQLKPTHTETWHLVAPAPAQAAPHSGRSPGTGTPSWSFALKTALALGP